MKEPLFRLHVETDRSLHYSFDEAKAEASKHMSERKTLRIVELEEKHEGVWWAYIYESEEWIPS